MNSTLSGHIEYQVFNEDNTIALQGSHQNLILDNGLNMIATTYYADCFLWCCVGTGTSTPIISQTALDVERARTSTYHTADSGACGTAIGTTRNQVLLTRSFQFAVGTLNSATHGNYTEVGFANSGTVGANLFSRSLFKDGGGTPVSIPITSTQYLRVKYTLTVTVMTDTLSAGTFNITGLGTIGYSSCVTTSTTYNISYSSKFGTYGLSLLAWISTTGLTTTFVTALGATGYGQLEPKTQSSVLLHSVLNPAKHLPPINTSGNLLYGLYRGVSSAPVTSAYVSGTFSKSETYTFGTGSSNTTFDTFVVSFNCTGSNSTSDYNAAFFLDYAAPYVQTMTPTDVLISSDGNFSYVLAYNSNALTITAFSRNSTTGHLTQLAQYIYSGIVYSPHSRLVLSPDNNYLYSLSTTYGTGAGTVVASFSRNSGTGLLTPLSPATLAFSSTTANRAIIRPDGLFMYASTGYTTLLISARNNTTGILSAASSTTISHSSIYIAISNDGGFLYSISATNIYWYSINSGTGAITLVSSATLPVTGGCMMTISPDNNYLYVSNNSNGDIYQYSRNTGTGALTALSPASINCGAAAYSMTISPSGGHMYVPVATPGITVFSISSGLLTSVTAASANPVFSITSSTPSISSDGKHYYYPEYTMNTISMFACDSVAGTLSNMHGPAPITKDSLHSLNIVITKTWGRA